MAFIYVISTNLVDIDFTCELNLFCLVDLNVKLTLSIVEKMIVQSSFLERNVLQFLA